MGVTVISKYELLAQVFHRRLGQEEAKVKTFLSRSNYFGLDSESADQNFKTMNRLLMSNGITVNAMSTLIADIAIDHKTHSIVSRDKDFLKISKVSAHKTILLR